MGSWPQQIVAFFLTLGRMFLSLWGWVRRRAVDLRAKRVARQRAFILVAALLVFAYALGVFGYALSLPHLGLRHAFTPLVVRVFPNSIHVFEGDTSPEQLRERARQLEGKVIVQVGQRPVASWPQLLRALVNLRSKPPQRNLDPGEVPGPKDTHVRQGDEEFVLVQFVDGESPESIGPFPRLISTPPPEQLAGPHDSAWFRVGSLPLSVLIPSALWLALKAGLFLVGAIVWWKRPDDRSAAQFFLLSIVTFGAYMGGYHWSRIITQPVLLVVFIVCGMMLPAVSLHFYLIFPRPKAFLTRHSRLVFTVVYGLPALFLLTVLLGYLRVRWLFLGGSTPETQGLMLQEILYELYLFFGLAALWYLASAVSLVHSYLTATDATDRNQVKWILYGVAASLIPIGYTLYLAVRQPEDFGGGSATWPMFFASAFVSTAFAISITRYRLMQLDQIVSSGVGYFLLSSLAGLVYYGVVFLCTLLFHQWIGGPSFTSALGVSTAALVIMLVLDWLRGRVKRVLDRRFYREKHQLDRTLQRMSQAIEQLVDPQTLARRLLQEAADLLGVERGAVYVRNGEPAVFKLASCLGPAPALTELPPGCPLVEALPKRLTMAVSTFEFRDDPAQRQLRFVGGEVAQALVHEGQLFAIVILGPKSLGVYGQDDLNLLSSFAQVAVLALVSAEGHRVIEKLTQELQTKVEKIAEQQRRILALQAALGSRQGDKEARRQGDKEKEEASSVSLSPGLPVSVSAGMIGSGPEVRRLLAMVRKVSDSQATVLIRGESGTGKEVLAKALHENSPRARKPFVKVHCAALSPTLLESELFGHVKGAFTSAHKDKVGRFELANSGTLFLDEIGDISLEVQTKLLRVLQEMTFERVGSSEPIRVDVRIIAATHQDLEKLIRQGRFREDLYYRLNVVSIRTPPLRDRREDIPELVQHFVKQSAVRSGRNVVAIDDDAMAALKAFSWPGNIRQLENAIDRAVVVADGATVTVRDLPIEVVRGDTNGDAVPVPSLDGEMQFVGVHAERADRDRRERDQLVRALAAASGNKAEAARMLGMARSTLLSRLKKHGLS